MRIGIYLAHAPAKNPSFKQEGLGRLLAYLVKSLEENGHQIVVATSSWTIGPFKELFESYGMDIDNMEVLLSNYEPQLLKIYLKYFGVKKTKNHYKLKKAAVLWIDKCMEGMLKIRHLITLIFVLVFSAAVIAVLLPFALIGGMLYGVFYLISKILHKQYVYSGLEEKIKKNSIVLGIYKHVYKKYMEENMVLQYFRNDMAKDLIRKIKLMKKPVDIWYCPMAFWPEFNRIPGKKVICMPDLVVSDFASNFSGMFSDVNNMKNIRSVVTEGQYFITYSEYLKKSLLMQQFGKKAENIIAIPHAINDMMDEIKISETYLLEDRNNSIFHRYIRTVLCTAAPNIINQEDYLGAGCSGFSFQNVKYIFYASQLRGNKNILNLVRAYHKLLRKKHMQIKLILTCRFYKDAEVTNYIQENYLQYDVLSFWGVSKQQLAALYACAELVVNPTFYEGGFPFTFGEGMSVGTPSVMSKIPQVLDVVEGYSLEKYMFDPYDVEDMADKIYYALKHREEVYLAEKELYEELDRRNWNDVGEEYVEAFQYFMEREKEVS